MSKTEELIEFFKNNNHSDEHPLNILEYAPQGLYDAVELKDEVFVDESRWSNIYHFIFYILTERAYVRLSVGVGKTENQDYCEIGDIEQVYPQEKVVVEYVTKDKIRAK